MKGPKMPPGFPVDFRAAGVPAALPAGFPGLEPEGGLPGFPPR